MKKLALFIFATIISLNCLFAQISFNTGSVELDKNLGIINTNAKLDLKTFKVDFSVKSNLSLPKIDELLEVMEPAEVVLANEISQIVEKPIDNVVSSYKVNKEKGWGAIAKDMGIKPGSEEFHQLKNMTKPKKENKSSEHKGNAKGKGKSNGKGKNK